MIINHNMGAINAHGRMGINQANAQKNMEKLSSGLRINRAGDDAAGLAISEKMRGQIRGLDQAARNAQDGISLIQTAEGALNETHSILQRMRELAVQSSNDTNVNVDRQEIQKEIDQLTEEITRISDTTQFNTQNLLKGDFKGKFHIGANGSQDITLEIGAMDAKTLGVSGKAYKATDVADVTNLQVTSTNGEAVKIKFTALGDKDAAAVTDTTAKFDKDTNEITITLKQAKGNGTNAGAIEATAEDVKKALESVAGKAGIKVSVKEGEKLAATALTAKPGDTTVGTTEDTDKLVGLNVADQKSASAAIETIQTAIESVSSERSKLGAYQNRLEHTINNLGTASENLTAAESRIRDVDMAKEMMQMSKNNILQQASQAMLAQANQLPQQVLQLLR